MPFTSNQIIPVVLDDGNFGCNPAELDKGLEGFEGKVLTARRNLPHASECAWKLKGFRWDLAQILWSSKI